MKIKILSAPLLALTLASTLAAQSTKAFLGRWDLVATPATGQPYPQWMELTENAGKIGGRVQPRGGAWKPIVGARMDGSKLIVDVGPAGPGTELSWELTSASKGKLTGMEKRGTVGITTLTAVKAPLLNRPMPKRWTKPEPLFDGKDLKGWEPIGSVR